MIKNNIFVTISAALLIIVITSCSKKSNPVGFDFSSQVIGTYALNSASYAGVPIPTTGNSAKALVTKETNTTIEINISETPIIGKSQSFDFKDLTLKLTTTPGIYSINDAAGTPYGTIGKYSINGKITYNSQPFTFSGSQSLF